MKKIKRILIVIMAFSFSLMGHANNELHEFGEAEGFLQIEIKSESTSISLQRQFETLDDLNLHTIDELLNSFSITEDSCTVSITVKVRIGIDSNFIELSATIHDVECSDVASVARRTIAQLKAGIK